MDNSKTHQFKNGAHFQLFKAGVHRMIKFKWEKEVSIMMFMPIAEIKLYN